MVESVHFIEIPMKEMDNKFLKKFNQERGKDFHFCWCSEYVQLRCFGENATEEDVVLYDCLLEMIVKTFVPEEDMIHFHNAELFLDRGRKIYFLLGWDEMFLIDDTNKVAISKAAATKVSYTLSDEWLNHCARVAQKCVDQYHDDTVTCVAWLHDVLEDSRVYTHKTFLYIFGQELYDAVDCLTRRENEVYIDEYIPRVMTNSIAVKVKIADLQDHLEHPETAPSESYIKRAKRALEILENNRRQFLGKKTII